MTSSFANFNWTAVAAASLMLTLASCGTDDTGFKAASQSANGSNNTEPQSEDQADKEDTAGSDNVSPATCSGLQDDACSADQTVAKKEVAPKSEPVVDSVKAPDPVTDDDTKPVVVTPDPAAGGDPNVIVFRIKSGTNTASWNTEATMLNLKIGQTLRLVNDDTVAHRLHTFGAPCVHQPKNFSPGQTFDCVASKVFDPKAAVGPLYDHIVGPTAEFWVKVAP